MMRQGSRVAIVTGGGSGIGRATCRHLVAAGFRVGVIDLDAAAARDACGDGGIGIGADVSLAAPVERAVRAVEGALGPVDVLVNNAGIAGSAAATRLHETPVDEWDRVLAVNVRGPYLCTRAVLPSMLRRGDGHVITIASVAALVPFPGRAAYTTSKGAALQLARSIARDYGADGIRSNAVCPGMVETPMTQWRLDRPDLRAEVEQRIPLHRLAQPDDIAEAVALLASGRLSYMNGGALVIDGGYTTF
jgi:NAD(P)-dependent dehydrogenase (short-subunit alcohol dehydrogenase family)